MTDYAIPNGDLEMVAEAFESIATGEVVAFRTVGHHGEDRQLMIRGNLRKASAYIAIPVHSHEEGWRLRKRCHLLTLDAIDQLINYPGLYGSFEYGAAIKAFKEATQEAVNNLARAEIDEKIRDAEACISQLETQRKKLDKAGADAYEVFLRRP